MSRCFSNNNTIPIKSSKEHTENKRNNSCPNIENNLIN